MSLKLAPAIEKRVYYSKSESDLKAKQIQETQQSQDTKKASTFVNAFSSIICVL